MSEIWENWKTRFINAIDNKLFKGGEEFYLILVTIYVAATFIVSSLYVDSILKNIEREYQMKL